MFCHWYKKFKLYILKYLDSKNISLCRLEEIDDLKKLFVIYCHGMGSLLRIKFDDLINDTAILANLPAYQAAWAGYYYGIYYKNSLNKKTQKPVVNFALSDKYGVYNITMLDREGNVFYMDKTKNSIHTNSPLNIIISKKIIEKFDPIQACYIGILAGLAISKNKTKTKNMSNSIETKLSLVK